jgi:hypothetical protein
MLIPGDDPRVTAATAAIQAGDVATLTRLLSEHPELATARVGAADPDCQETRTLLHVATDWPGHFAEGPATVAALVAAGADVNAHMESTRPSHRETPLHWAASSNDVAVRSGPPATAASSRPPSSCSPGAPIPSGSAGTTSPPRAPPAATASARWPTGPAHLGGRGTDAGPVSTPATIGGVHEVVLIAR